MKKKTILLIITLCIMCLPLYFKENKKTQIKLSKTNIIKKLPENSFQKKQIKEIIYNKVIIIGDSRMEFLKDRENEIKIPKNFNFIALSSTKIDWFKKVAIIKLNKKLENRNEKYKYHIIINMGVNDLNDNEKVEKHANNYLKLINNLVKENKDINFYFLSVNPITDKIIGKYFKPQKRTTEKIKEFNKIILKSINNQKYKNLSYCDSYNNIDFGIPDGLHYDKDTDQKIVDFIVKDCVKY